MQFLFSTSIGRLPFLGRFIASNIVLALLAIHLDGTSKLPDPSLIDELGTSAIGLAVVFYQVRYVILARLESIGASLWYGLIILLVFSYGIAQQFWGNAILDSSSILSLLPFAVAAIYLLFILALIILPEGAFQSADTLQAIMYNYEAGEGRVIIILVPLTVAITVIACLYNFGPVDLGITRLGGVFHGLNDAQSMDNAQLARQIVRGEGYTTRFLRPQAITELQNYAATRSLTTTASADLFPPAQFPHGAPRILPDTYNAPGYPCLLATWFYLVRPHFDEATSPHLDGFVDPGNGKVSSVYSGDRWIPPLNLIFVILTGVLIYFMASRLFDDRVAWLAVVGFFATDLVWQFSLTGLSTSFLMFLVTAMIFCALEIFCVAEMCLESEDASFGMAWAWGLLLSLSLAAACLTRLPLLVLLIPLLVLLLVMPRPSWSIFFMIVFVSAVAVLPWFWHMYKVSGRPWGTNDAFLVYGTEGYKENQIFCASSIPKYESLFRNATQKEFDGFLWHIGHGWELLGTNLLVLLFFASLLHAYKRCRAQMFQWFLVGTSVILIGVNNLGSAQPETLGGWNVLVLLLPGMVVMGSAFFFIQLDRLNLQVWLLNNIIIITLIVITALPLGITLTSVRNFLYAFPPYIPPLIKILSTYSRQDEWVTSDMPWATAWYADRPSLWLPDSVADFTALHDNVCPTGILFLTPETWGKPASNLLTGEDREWLPFTLTNFLPPRPDNQPNVLIPANFPLPTHTVTPGATSYVIWSDRPRWLSH